MRSRLLTGDYEEPKFAKKPKHFVITCQFDNL